VPTVRSDAARIAVEISEAVSAVDHALTFPLFLQLADNLAAEHGATRVGLTLTEPVPTGSAEWDSAIAALCEHRLTKDKLPVPDWIAGRTGNREKTWSPHTSDNDIPPDLSQVPEEFLRRGILIEAATLESV